MARKKCKKNHPRNSYSRPVPEKPYSRPVPGGTERTYRYTRPATDPRELMDGMDIAYDVCIVGAGPHALSVLSAIRKNRGDAARPETTQASICVIDPAGKWLLDWDAAFDALDIEFLRSPAWAHPDATSQEAMVDFAKREGRMSEFKCVNFQGTSLDRTSMSSKNASYFKNPSTKLFKDFCDSLIAGLPHDMVCGWVTDVKPVSDTGGRGLLQEVIIEPSRRLKIVAKHVVLALGARGCPSIPATFKSLVNYGDCPRVVHSSDFNGLAMVKSRISKTDTVLVIGGGLSAAQAALLAVRRKAHRTVLCSRRPLVCQHYDLPIEWMDDRLGANQARNRHRTARYYTLPPADRIKACKSIRGGGSIPPDYLEALDLQVRTGRLELFINSVCAAESTNDSVTVHLDDDSAITASYVILGTGWSMDCLQVPLLAALATRYGLPVQGGLPLLDEGLFWHERINLVGAFAAGSLGPDAANLLGARKGGALVATCLGQGGGFYRKEKHVTDEFSLEL